MLIVFTAVVNASCIVENERVAYSIRTPSGYGTWESSIGSNIRYGNLDLTVEEIDIETNSACDVVDKSATFHAVGRGDSYSDESPCASAILALTDEISCGRIKVKLDDISVAVGESSVHNALLTINHNPAIPALRRNVQISPGECKMFFSHRAKVCVEETAYGYETYQRWAEVKIYEMDFSSYRILALGDQFTVDRYYVKLSDIGVAERHGDDYNAHGALLDLMDRSTGYIVESKKIFPNECKIMGDEVKVCVEETAYGYETYQRWAKLGIIERDILGDSRITLREGESIVIGGNTIEVTSITADVSEEVVCRYRPQNIEITPSRKSVYPGESIEYELEIENNDESCNRVTFVSTYTINGLAYTTNYDSWDEISISSGRSAEITMRFHVPSNAEPGTYYIHINVEHEETGNIERETVYYTVKGEENECIKTKPTANIMATSYSNYIDYTVTAKNNDGDYCDRRSFQAMFSSDSDTEYFDIEGQKSYRLEPGESTTFNITLTPKSDTPAGDYTFNFLFYDIAEPSYSYEARLTYRVEEQTNPERYTVSVKQGWNLVPYIYGASVYGCPNFEVVWVYSPIEKRYIQLNNNFEFLNEMEGEDFVSIYGDETNPRFYVPYSGAWVYSEHNCDFKVEYDYTNMPQPNGKNNLDSVRLSNGWNFVQVMPWMGGKDFQDITKNCNVEKVFSWNAETQEWEGPAPNSFRISGDNIGEILVVETISSCYLSDGFGSMEPPTLPN